MKLRRIIIEDLAKMVIGDNANFPYKSSSVITQFCQRCGLPWVHDGSTRKRWMAERLEQINLDPSQLPDLPSDALLVVIAEMFDIDDFEKAEKSRDIALVELNNLFGKQGLIAYFDPSGQCHVRNTGTGVNSSTVVRQRRPLSAEEVSQRSKVSKFLASASEDEFTERLLVPLFQRLGFHRISVAGHREKSLEFGKDLWMKYQLPTSHWIYFGVQVKRGKLDVQGGSGSSNTATVLDQVRMALGHPVFDPDMNRKVLVDHMFIISAAEITRAARSWLIENLDQSQRRHIIFMDRDEFLDQSARILLDLQLEDPDAGRSDMIPF
jgi:hypothetical protein